MDGSIWLYDYKNKPIVEEFCQKFGGHFSINPDNNMLFYTIGPWGSSKSYFMPEDETESWNLIVQSVERSENLILNQRMYQTWPIRGNDGAKREAVGRNC